MMTPVRIIRSIGILGVIGWLILMGWFGSSSLAQNGARHAQNITLALSEPPAQPGSSTPVAKPGPPPGPIIGSTDPVDPVQLETPPPPPLPTVPPATQTSIDLPEPVTPTEPTAAHQVGNSETGVAKLPLAPQKQANATTAPQHIGIAAVPDTGGPGGDPEHAAVTFLERNRHEVEEHIKTLTDEADQLRCRLTKIEAGINRWQGLLDALKHSQDDRASLGVAPVEPLLSPISPIASGGRVEAKSNVATKPAPASPAPLTIPVPR